MTTNFEMVKSGKLHSVGWCTLYLTITSLLGILKSSSKLARLALLLLLIASRNCIVDRCDITD